MPFLIVFRIVLPITWFPTPRMVIPSSLLVIRGLSSPSSMEMVLPIMTLKSPRQVSPSSPKREIVFPWTTLYREFSPMSIASPDTSPLKQGILSGFKGSNKGEHESSINSQSIRFPSHMARSVEVGKNPFPLFMNLEDVTSQKGALICSPSLAVDSTMTFSTVWCPRSPRTIPKFPRETFPFLITPKIPSTLIMALPSVSPTHSSVSHFTEKLFRSRVAGPTTVKANAELPGAR
mmetsp:Transcript_28840/g.32401  ORF Transcript_28840/g.32401 Transcript_28840/m.32401 type:complete len:234 (+) Transcript_28840:507-1208(+)